MAEIRQFIFELYGEDDDEDEEDDEDSQNDQDNLAPRN